MRLLLEQEGAPAGTPFAYFGTETMRPILVVEDNDDSRAILVDTLRAEGYEVVEASGGRKALELLEHLDPCLVLLDLMMPDVPGEQVLDHLRRTGRLDRMRVIVLTGLEGGFDVPGAYLVLPKPFALHQLVSQVEHICPPAPHQASPS